MNSKRILAFPVGMLFLVLLYLVYLRNSNDLDYNSKVTIDTSLGKKLDSDNQIKGDTSIAKRLQQSEDAYQHLAKKRKAIYNNFNLDTVGAFAFDFVMWDLFYPSFSCPFEIMRVGKVMDGGKYVCGLSQIREAKNCVVYSFGIADDSSFEHEIHENTNCEIFAFDYSVDSVPDAKNDVRFHFAKVKVGDVDSVEGGIVTKTLQTIMKENGHDFIDILKMDAEGAEWSVFPKILDKSKFQKGFPVGQILLEIHASESTSARTADNFFRAFEEVGFRPFKNELNYFYGNRIGKIHLMEYALLNVKVPHAANGYQVAYQSEQSIWK